MPRNAEVIRQWTILREIERARGGGVTIDDLASLCKVTTRTIRRDLQALEVTGFPLYPARDASLFEQVQTFHRHVLVLARVTDEDLFSTRLFRRHAPL